MKKLITRLYNRYCRPQLDELYLGGIQRDFTKELKPPERKQRNIACIEFVNSKACDYIFNEILKEYSEALFNIGEKQELRDVMHNNINVVLRVEQKIRNYAYLDTAQEIEDPYNPL